MKKKLEDNLSDTRKSEVDRKLGERLDQKKKEEEMNQKIQENIADLRKAESDKKVEEAMMNENRKEEINRKLQVLISPIPFYEQFTLTKV